VARPRTVDVCEAVREALDGLTGDQAAVLADLPAAAPAKVDPQHLRQILLNLLTNAVKYGRPPLSVTVRADPDSVTVTVADHGPGVPEEFVEHLFDRYTRAAATAGAPGTGIGLYIVRELARANGASIAFQPNRPTGSRFILRLSTMESERPGAEASTARPQPGHLVQEQSG